MKASLLLTLEDQLTSGLDRLVQLLGGLNEVIEKVTGSLSRLALGEKFEQAVAPIDAAAAAVAKVDQQLVKAGKTAATLHERFQKLWHAAAEIGPMGGAAAGFGIVEPVKKFAEYENTLRHIAITEGKDGAAAEDEIKRLTKLFAEDSQHSGQSSESIAKAYYDLVTTGIPAKILDRVIGAHSMAATAYNVSAESLGPAVGALLSNMKVPEEDIGGALAAMATAAKEGRFKVEDFSRELPGVTGFMSGLGMKGRGASDYAFAALETVMKNASNPGQAAADFNDALNYLTGNAAKEAFKKSGVDLPALLLAGEKNGRNPMDTILDKLSQMTHGQSPVKMAETLHSVLHNQQAEQAIMALLQHREEFEALRKKLDAVDQHQVDKDFGTAAADPSVQVRLLSENLDQMTRVIGEGFAPVLVRVNAGLSWLREWLAWANENFPVGTAVVLGAVGGFLAFAAVLGTIGFVLPSIAAGVSALGAVLGIVGGVFAFLLSPVVLLTAAVVALGLAAVAVYTHWADVKAFLIKLWDDPRAAFDQFAAWVAGWASGPVNTVKSAFGSLKDWFAGLWAEIRGPFEHFAADVANLPVVKWLLGGHSAAAASPAGAAGAHGFAAPAAPGAPAKVDVHITHDPGIKVQDVSGDVNRATSGTAGSAARAVGRD